MTMTGAERARALRERRRRRLRKLSVEVHEDDARRSGCDPFEPTDKGSNTK